MENKIYYIYHIPTFRHKDGMVGKIGCSEEPEKRVNDQGYTDYEILEEFKCIYLVSYREIALQKEYGYPVDKMLYWMSVKHRRKWNDDDRKKSHKSMQDNGFFKTWYKKGNLARIKSVLQFTKNGDFVAEHKSLSDAARSIGKEPSSAIAAVCKGKRPSIYGYVWKYKPTST